MPTRIRNEFLSLMSEGFWEAQNELGRMKKNSVLHLPELELNIFNDFFCFACKKRETFYNRIAFKFLNLSLD